MKLFHGCNFFEKVARGFTGARINSPLFFSWVQCFFFFFCFIFYIKISRKIQPKKKRKNVKFTLEEQIIKFSQFLCRKIVKFRQEKKKHWLGAVLFVFSILLFSMSGEIIHKMIYSNLHMKKIVSKII
jgi:hypothetical protein